MVNILLSRAEALLIVELVNKARDSLTQALIIGVEEENAKDEVARAAKNNYVTNLEVEVKRLEQQVEALKDSNEVAKAVKKLQQAPYGMKKDGTPKAKPGRKTAGKITKRKTKGTK